MSPILWAERGYLRDRRAWLFEFSERYCFYLTRTLSSVFHFMHNPRCGWNWKPVWLCGDCYF